MVMFKGVCARGSANPRAAKTNKLATPLRNSSPEIQFNTPIYSQSYSDRLNMDLQTSVEYSSPSREYLEQIDSSEGIWQYKTGEKRLHATQAHVCHITPSGFGLAHSSNAAKNSLFHYSFHHLYPRANYESNSSESLHQHPSLSRSFFSISHSFCTLLQSEPLNFYS
jgi:hypothetical protein